MDIRNQNDLKVAYHMAHTMAETIAKATGLDRDSAAEMLNSGKWLKGIKRDIPRSHTRSSRTMVWTDI